ncbi:MAG: DUF1570 domain-containing protein [Planctomycetota bacterium]
MRLNPLFFAAFSTVCLSLLLCLSASARPPQLETYESRHYEIRTNLSRDEAVKLGQHMDLVFREYDRVLRALRGSARGLQPIYLLRTKEQYHALLDAKYGIDARGSGGMFFWRGNRSGLAVFVEGRNYGDLLSTLQHEGFHQFAWIKMRDNLPLWVNEGLAEYFGDAIVVDGKVRHGIVNARRLARLRDAEEKNILIPFGEVLEIDSDRWMSNMRGGSPRGYLQYDQSWSIVHFLIHDSPKQIRPAFEQYLKLLSTNRNPQQTWNDAFGKDSTPAFERRYSRFLKDLEPDAYSSALIRLRFLASGMETLLEDADAETPEDLDQLKSALRGRGFGISYRAHGQTTTYHSDDDAMFEYRDRRNKPHAFELQAGRDKTMPHEIVANELSPRARIVWTRDSDGVLHGEVKFGR